MAYGMQVVNSSGRTIFDTNIDYPVVDGDGFTNLTGYYQALPSVSAGQILIGRPPANTTAVVATEYSSGFRTLGSNTTMQNFALASGFRYRTIQRASNRSASTSGYGIEVFDSSSNLMFSSQRGSIPEILAFGEIGFGDKYEYNSPGDIAFNNIYVGLLGMNAFYQSITILGSTTTFISGQWAHFDDTNERITVINNTIFGGGAWDSGSYSLGYLGVNRRTFVIYGVRG